MQQYRTNTQIMGANSYTFSEKSGLFLTECELIENPNVNTIKNIVTGAIKSIRLDSKENAHEDIKLLILDHGLWSSKYFEKELKLVLSKIKKATKHIAGLDESYRRKVADTLIRHYMEEYRLNAGIDKAYEKHQKTLESNANAYTPPKARATKINQIALDKVVLDDTISKNARMYKLKHMGIDTKMIAGLMGLKPARVRNGIRTETKKMEK